MDEALKLANSTVLVISGDKKLMLFSIQKAFLNILGFDWFPGGVNLPLPAFVKHTLYRLLYPVLMIVVAILILVYVFTHEVVTENDFIIKINGYIVSMTFFAASFKVLIFIFQKNMFKELFLMVEMVGAIDTDAPSTKSHIYNCYIYITLVLMNPGTWAAWWVIVHNDTPFRAQYPWGNEGFGYMLSYFVGVNGAVFCGLCHILVDTSFMMVVAGITLHVDMLSASLSYLGKNRFKDNKILSAAIDKHAELLRVSQHLSQCYSNLFVAQSVYTVGHSCVLLFGAVHVASQVEVVMNQGTMLATSYSQLLVYCYYGELLTTKFSDLVFDSYNNKWYDCELSVQKALPNLTLMSMRHVSLRGFGNVHPSKSNWLHSLQESVSYFLFLKTISGEK
uniref:Odorant receptor n=1 Tax=Adelphocoris lineolatus TaxID=236346 RepID=A0A2I4PH27_ADELI|nr:olfactory receptor 31 [Adelphocoris lineolatus]